MPYFAGFEGGATCSKIIILDETGKLFYENEGPGTNIWVYGKEETCQRISKMLDIKDGFREEIAAVGLSLSGLENDESKDYLKHELEKRNIAKHVFTCSDTVSPIATASNKGGFVLISGTGSNCRLLNIISNTTYTCGGWGHMIGDRGSAFNTARMGISYIFDAIDNFIEPNEEKYDIDYLHKAMLSYFKIKHKDDILASLYTEFEKSKVAGFTLEIAKGCQQNDGLCLNIFEKTGYDLGSHVCALVPKMDKELKELEEGCTIVCTGSMFKSWKYLKPGFCKALDKLKVMGLGNGLKFKLVLLKTPSHRGAALLAAKHCCDIEMDVNYNEQIDILDTIVI